MLYTYNFIFHILTYQIQHYDFKKHLELHIKAYEKGCCIYTTSLLILLSYISVKKQGFAFILL